MKKATILIVALALLAGCATTTLDEVTIHMMDGTETTYTPTEADMCGDGCLVYPEDGMTYMTGEEANEYYPEGTGGISEEAAAEVQEIIEETEENWEE